MPQVQSRSNSQYHQSPTRRFCRRRDVSRNQAWVTRVRKIRQHRVQLVPLQGCNGIQRGVLGEKIVYVHPPVGGGVLWSLKNIGDFKSILVKSQGQEFQISRIEEPFPQRQRDRPNAAAMGTLGAGPFPSITPAISSLVRGACQILEEIPVAILRSHPLCKRTAVHCAAALSFSSLPSLPPIPGKGGSCCHIADLAGPCRAFLKFPNDLGGWEADCYDRREKAQAHAP